MYLPVRVSTLIFSPVLMKSGACTVMPVSSVIGFCTLLDESPRMPSGASVTVNITLDGSSMETGLVIDKSDRDHGILHQVIFGVPHQLRRQCRLLVSFRVGENKIVPVLVTEIHFPRHHRDDVNFLRRTEADIGSLAGFDAAEGGLDKSAEVARRAMLCFQHHGDVAIIINGHAFA